MNTHLHPSPSMNKSMIRLSLSDKRYDEISKKVRETYPKACVCYIDEIKNDFLSNRFQERVSEEEKEPTILQLFHGTREVNINSIMSEGFCVSKNKMCAYGIGTYFARDAMMSYLYTDSKKNNLSFMFLCDVLIGKKVLSRSGQILNKGETGVNNKTEPTIFSVPEDSAILPRYLIAFYKYA